MPVPPGLFPELLLLLEPLLFELLLLFDDPPVRLPSRRVMRTKLIRLSWARSLLWTVSRPSRTFTVASE